VVTNSGGPGILAADALEAQGMSVAELHARTVERLRPILPEDASLRNPLDLMASASPQGYRAALEALLSDPGIDAIMSIFVPPLGIRQEDIAEAIVAAKSGENHKPLLAVLMGRQGLPQGKAELHAVGVPAYIFPESAARALGAMCRYREWRERPLPVPEPFEVDTSAAQRILARARAAGRARLDEIEARDLLVAYGILTPEAVLATTEDEAIRSADRMGYPVVMKVMAPAILHKSDVGGVRVGIGNAPEARDAWREIMAGARRARPEAVITGIMIQPMVAEGREMIVGMTRDPSVGALLMFGLGGTLVEVLGDVVFRLAPINRLDAAEMVRGIRSIRLLQGVRGAPPASLTALEDVLLRVSRLVTDFPEIAELDINPVLAFADRAVAVDARVMLHATAG
jgi:acetyltransferase